MTFNKWIDTLIEEKGLNLGHVFEVDGPVWGMNMIPLESVVEQIKTFPPQTQKLAKNKLVGIDFANGDVMHFFKYIAEKMAM